MSVDSKRKRFRFSWAGAGMLLLGAFGLAFLLDRCQD